MYFIDTNKIKKAAQKTMEYLDQRRRLANFKKEEKKHFYACLEMAINNVFGSSTLSPTIYGKVKNAISLELHRMKEEKKKDQEESSKKTAKESRDSETGFKSHLVSPTKMNNIFARAIEYHAVVRYVGSINKWIARSIHEFEPNMSESDKDILLQDVKLTFCSNKKASYHRDKKTKKVLSKTAQDLGPPRPQQLSWNFNKQTNSIEHY